MAKYPNLKSLRAFYKGHKAKIFFFILFTALAGGIALAFPFASSQILINLTGGDLDNGKFLTAVKFALILFGLIAAGAALEMASDFFYAKANNALFLSIRRETALKTMSMNLSAVYDKSSGFFLERLNEDSREAGAVFLNISRAIINLIINLGFIFYITALNPLLGLIFAAGLSVIIVMEYVRVSKMLANMKKSKRAVEKVKANEAEILKGIKEIKGLNAKAALIEKHSALSSEFVKIKYGREIFQKKMQRGIDLVKAASDLALIAFAALYLLPKAAAGVMGAPDIEIAAVLVVWSYKGNIYELVASLARIKDHYVNGELAAKRINDIVRAPESETDTFGDKELPAGAVTSVEFKDVFFEYSPERPVLSGVSFRVDAPGVYGFVGKSGSGKSTVFSLLSGFYKPSSGQILLGGEDIKELSESAVRGGITPVLQDSYIFNDTVLNNLLFARSSATLAEVEEACRAARIHDEILGFPDGYATVVGENGATVSGGQKQRLEIARALLKGADVVLFDEATSALDKNNLDKINDLMLELGKTKIVLVIAHRLGVMRKCDKVAVLDGGRVLAFSPHSELMESCGIYAELFRKNSAAEQAQPVAEGETATPNSSPLKS